MPLPVKNELPQRGEMWRHTGVSEISGLARYRVFALADRESSKPVGQREKFIVYSGDTGHYFVRPLEEFMERFEKCVDVRSEAYKLNKDEAT